jgi:hypothetical protein
MQHQVIVAVLAIFGWSGFLLESTVASSLRSSNNNSDNDGDSIIKGSRRSLEAVADPMDPRSVTPRTQQPLFTNQVESLQQTDQSTLPPLPVEPNGHPTFELLLEQFVPEAERSNYLINVGAQDGKNHDPTYPLLEAGYDGILFEGFERVKQQLYDNVAALPHHETIHPHIAWGYVSPDTVLQSLSEGGARKDPDVLKLDIDSFDAHLMETILAGGYRAKVIMAEFNPDVPPPLAWHQLYSTHPFNFMKVVLGNYGATASGWFEILTEKFGYGLVGMEVADPDAECVRCEHNMWFVHGDLLNRRGFRAMNHQEMTGLFWATHYEGKRQTGKIACIHAKNPCLLETPEELTDAIPGYDGWEGDQLQTDTRLSLMIAESRALPCEVWKAYESSVIQNFLRQMEDGCNCSNCVKGDPCLAEWNIHTKMSNTC